MKSGINKLFFGIAGLGLLLIFTGDTVYGQCGTRGHKPCVKVSKARAKKKVVRVRKKVIRRKRNTHAASAKRVIPPRDPQKFTIIGSKNPEGTPPNFSADVGPPPVYQGPPRDSWGIPKQIAGGVLNGKAISLPKPAYPPAARAVRASGAVNVQVLINEDGKVISAQAVSGHPLLRAVSVEAARGAKFSPTRLSGQPVKVSGIITYNFIP